MVGYNVYRNDEMLCVAGVGDFGVLTALVTWVGHSPEKLARVVDMSWMEADIRIGDEIKIQVVDVAEVDAPTTEYYDDPVKDLERKKDYVRQLAKEFGWEIRES